MWIRTILYPLAAGNNNLIIQTRATCSQAADVIEVNCHGISWTLHTNIYLPKLKPIIFSLPQQITDTRTWEQKIDIN